MTNLNREARRVLADAGIAVRDWIAYGEATVACRVQWRL